MATFDKRLLWKIPITSTQLTCMNLGEGGKKVFQTSKRISGGLYVGGLNCTLPANFELQPESSERRQIRVTSSYQMYEIKVIFQQNGRYNQNKFWEFSGIHKARMSWIQHYRTHHLVGGTGGFLLQYTIGCLDLSYGVEQRKQSLDRRLFFSTWRPLDCRGGGRGFKQLRRMCCLFVKSTNG